MPRWSALVAAAVPACTTAEPAAEAPEWLRPAEPATLATPDLPEKPGDPRWRVLPALAACDAHLAAKPEALGRTLAWQPCPSGAPGCRALLPGDERSDGRLAYDLLAGWTDAGVVLAIFERGEREQISLAALDSRPFLTLDLMGRLGKCGFLRADFSASTAAIGVTVDTGAEPVDSVYLAGPLRADPLWHAPAAREAGYGAMALHGRALIRSSGSIRRSDPRTGAFTEVASGGFACCGAAVGTSTVYLEAGRIVAAVAPGAAPVVLHTPGPVVHDVQLVAGAFYWTRGVGEAANGDVERVELWTAPATDEPARFVARKIADLELPQNPGYHGGRVMVDALVVGGGKVAVCHHHPPLASSRVVVVDVASGAQRVWQTDGDSWPERALFVTPDELAVEVVDPDRRSSFVRVPLATLAPLVPGTADATKADGAGRPRRERPGRSVR